MTMMELAFRAEVARVAMSFLEESFTRAVPSLKYAVVGAARGTTSSDASTVPAVTLVRTVAAILPFDLRKT